MQRSQATHRCRGRLTLGTLAVILLVLAGGIVVLRSVSQRVTAAQSRHTGRVIPGQKPADPELKKAYIQSGGGLVVDYVLTAPKIDRGAFEKMFGGRIEAVAMQFLEQGEVKGNVTLFRMESPEAARTAVQRAARARNVRYHARGLVVLRVNGPPELQAATEAQISAPR